jgi:CspA family cold shock protein
MTDTYTEIDTLNTETGEVEETEETAELVEETESADEDIEVHADDLEDQPEEIQVSEDVPEVAHETTEVGRVEINEAGAVQIRDEDEEADEESNGDKVTGTVKWFNPAKGYGFIDRDNGADVFVHFSAIETSGFGGFRTLREGDRVEFEVEQAPKGPRAAHVKTI